MSLAPWQWSIFRQAVDSLEAGRLGHALLLSGPAHIGKHAVLEALGRRLLCLAPAPDGQACGQCRGCQLSVAQSVGLVTTQAHPDMQRISLELNEKGDKLRGEIVVDQVRRLGHWFSLTPQMGGAQVALIEPADMMNSAAANALLKTLEEPSRNRFLLMATAHPGRLKATIRSRCQRLEFRLPEPEEALAWLHTEGFTAAQANEALEAARGNPGLAAHWLRSDGLPLRRQVGEQLGALAAGRAAPVATAQAWLADEWAGLRMRFAAELALEAGAGLLGAAPPRKGMASPPDFMRLSRWFDDVNRAREQLRAPLRHDLVLAGLLHEWRTMFEQGR